jgi:DNA-binding IclR family transcriptional regulator
MKNEKNSNSVVKSAKRALEIFEFFAEVKKPATVMEVARTLDYPQSSTSVLMESLRNLGYLSYDRFTRQFTPTLRIAFMGNWVQENMYNDGNLLRMMGKLQRETGETVILGLQNDIHVQYMHSIQAIAPLRLFVRSGALRPLARAATGKMLLSAKSDEEIRALVIRINAEEEQSQNRIKLKELMADIEQCRESGYSMTVSSVTEGAGVIAVLLNGSPGQPLLSVGIGAPNQRLAERKQEIVDTLRDVLQL